jgi:hypothetical protein
MTLAGQLDRGPRAGCTARGPGRLGRVGRGEAPGCVRRRVWFADLGRSDVIRYH